MNPAHAQITTSPHFPPTQSPISIERIGDEVAAEWDAYVNRCPQASIYHFYLWRKLIRDLFGHESHYFVARGGDGRICGVLPAVRLRSLLFGDFMVSMPYFNYGGPAADSSAIAQALNEAAARCAESLGVSHLELRCTAPVMADWPTRTDKVAMLLELPDSAEALSKRLGAKVRSQIKRPIREGAVAVSGGAELLDDFYAVFSRNMRDLGTPVYSRAFFATILEALGPKAKLFAVRLNGSPVAASFVIRHRDSLEVPWASSLREANPIGVNMLLYWSMLEYACAEHCTVFDFGRSTVDAGTYRFKKQWGAQPHQLHWQYWMRGGGAPPMLNPSNPKYRLAVSVWRRLPLAVTNRLGPLLVRNLP